jgi:hypothetical protein
MAYVKNTWVDQEGQVRYTETEDGGYKIFTPNFEQVTEIGTPVNADNMNHIEDGIADCYDYVNTQITAMLSTIYPVGSIYISTSETNPLEALFGTWELVAADKALWTGDGTNANTTKAAGLPNLTGEVRQLRTWTPDSTYSGVFKNTTQQNRVLDADSGSTDDVLTLKFNASSSNSIYGKSSTVQPPAYVVNVWRRVA